jgi:hypothetical protein
MFAHNHAETPFGLKIRLCVGELKRSRAFVSCWRLKVETPAIIFNYLAYVTAIRDRCTIDSLNYPQIPRYKRH